MNNFAYTFPNMRVGRFFLKKGEEIPLHIHPEQYGMAYLLTGKAEVTTYNILSQEDNQYRLEVESVDILCGGEHQVLTPVKNGHKIIAVEDTWFLDTFAPGRETGYLSVYLNIIEESRGVIVSESIPFDEAALPLSLIENNAIPQNID